MYLFVRLLNFFVPEIDEVTIISRSSEPLGKLGRLRNLKSLIIEVFCLILVEIDVVFIFFILAR